jgi:GNAT superfamily N-acetyltransferase
VTTEANHSNASSTGGFRSRIEGLRSRIAGRLELGLYSRLTRYGLGRDLAVRIEKPRAKIPITVRALQSHDMASLFGNADLNPVDRREAAWRMAFIAKGAHRGFVAIDERSDEPCYAQWLFGAMDNDVVRRLKGFPALKTDQALLENAYTPPAYRGLGIMSAAMALIAERAADIGARHVLTFVGQDNIASLKGCQRAGFHPVMLHHSVRAAFGVLRRDSFDELADNDPCRTARF